MTIQQQDDLAQQEIWESTIPGVTWVTVTDRRGLDRSVKVGGGQRLRIRTIDRVLTQERILREESDPFTNGTLKQIVPGGEGLTAEQDLENRHYTDQAMASLLRLQDMEFLEAVDSLEERGLRTLKIYVEAHKSEATLDQSSTITTVLEEKWPLGKVMPSTEEILTGQDE